MIYLINILAVNEKKATSEGKLIVADNEEDVEELVQNYVDAVYPEYTVKYTIDNVTKVVNDEL